MKKEFPEYLKPFHLDSELLDFISDLVVYSRKGLISECDGIKILRFYSKRRCDILK